MPRSLPTGLCLSCYWQFSLTEFLQLLTHLSPCLINIHHLLKSGHFSFEVDEFKPNIKQYLTKSTFSEVAQEVCRRD